MHELFSIRLYALPIGLKIHIFQRFSSSRASEEKRRALVFIHSIFCFIRTQGLDRYPPGVYIENTPEGYMGNDEVLTYGR